MKPWSFIAVSDMQPGSPKSFRYAPAWMKNWQTAKEQILEINPDLLLIPGDLTRDGSIHRFELDAMKKDLDALALPYHVVPGNMDAGNKHTDRAGMFREGHDQCRDIELNITSDQLQQFASVFGPLFWSFVHKNVRFSGFPDMIVNSGLPEENEFWAWAERLSKLPHAEHHVWIMHYAMFADDINEPNWNISEDPEQYDNWYFCIDQPGRNRLLDLFKSTGTDIVISGHIHCHKVACAEGIRFEVAPATSFGQWGKRWPDGDDSLGFLRYDVGNAGIESIFVPLEKTFNLEGYGPQGHPAPHARDYSIAWEKGPDTKQLYI